jgi:transposase InsO family protein
MKIYEYANTIGIDVSRHQVYKVYEQNNLFQYRFKPPPQDRRCRYEACQKDLIWHTDLHNVIINDVPKYLIAFLDDATRFIIGWRILETKDASNTARFLQDTLNQTKPVKPFVLWSDNGTEFKAQFQQLLENEGIIHRWTTPHNPQQNGKIERFWRNVKKLNNERDIGFKIRQYNEMPHTGLPKIRRKTRTIHMTPGARYENLVSWREGKRTWTKDHVEYNFLNNETPRGDQQQSDKIIHNEIATITLREGEMKKINFPEPENYYIGRIVQATLEKALSGDIEVAVTSPNIEKNNPDQPNTLIIAKIKSGEIEAEGCSFIFRDEEMATFSVKGPGVVNLIIEFEIENDDDVDEDEEEEEDEYEDEDWSEEEEEGEEEEGEEEDWGEEEDE